MIHLQHLSQPLYQPDVLLGDILQYITQRPAKVAITRHFVWWYLLISLAQTSISQWPHTYLQQSPGAGCDVLPAPPGILPWDVLWWYAPVQ